MQNKLNFEFSVFDRTSQKLSHAFQKGIQRDDYVFSGFRIYKECKNTHDINTHASRAALLSQKRVIIVDVTTKQEEMTNTSLP